VPYGTLGDDGVKDGATRGGMYTLHTYDVGSSYLALGALEVGSRKPKQFFTI